MCQAPGMKGLLLCNPRSAQETSTLGTSGLSAPKLSLSTTDKTLKLHGQSRRAPSLALQGLNNILKKGEGPNRMGVSGCA